MSDGREWPVLVDCAPENPPVLGGLYRRAARTSQMVRVAGVSSRNGYDHCLALARQVIDRAGCCRAGGRQVAFCELAGTCAAHCYSSRQRCRRRW